jgi:hypothetical protein
MLAQHSWFASREVPRPRDSIYQSGEHQSSTTALLTSFPDHDKLLQDAYSVQIPTHFGRRAVCARALRFLANYSSDFPLDIFVIWIDRRYPGLVPTRSDYGLFHCQIPIHFLTSSQRPSLNDRFLIPSLLRTKTIISWDNDLIVAPAAIHTVFKFYLESQWTSHIVGPSARSCQGNRYIFSAVNFSIIFTNFAFFGN